MKKLLADIGGTNARFALLNEDGELENIKVLQCADYKHIKDAVKAYLNSMPCPKNAAFAMACPITGDYIKFSNNNWEFSQSELKRELGFDNLILLNDFKAQALALYKIDKTKLLKIGGAEVCKDSPKALIGPGTGLGVSVLIPQKHGAKAYATEGGHVSFCPFNEVEQQIFDYAKQKFKKDFHHISAERFLCGSGIELIYEALTKQKRSNKEIVSNVNNCPNCHQTLEIFCQMLGTIASNLALSIGAKGGVYICGGIIPKNLEFFTNSAFRQRFEDKGRMSNYLKQIPTFVVLETYSGIVGAAVALEMEEI
ncbi:glucokinase [Campylobacter canadensis]|uniref:Glucokinase n=1 Tax=Campylobacter canadensis TaxID=449520 RepID=A0ABS7WS19_9BACT|nr:glucokinase [Campylobacter canadensis]MBZ7987127.1 glucokinase [Campylobacter canadensis]MBZ7994519.1 glucokinase [Campylobacter canadensis]MBZ7997206.1 glucokinase [Campylobacter canadensis]MBZ7999766.1 glucokinase [Campylobacter canadensis]MBZ8002528.1 glucokinase [Campylobacter canadensis]